MTARKNQLLVAFLAVVLHLSSMSLAPNGYHRWREADTATVAENFSIDRTPTKPRVNVLGNSGGIVGTELPVYTYATALLYNWFGFHHAWPRILTLLSCLLVLFGLRRLLAVLGENLQTQNLVAYLALCSPLVFFYGAKIQPDMLGLALLVWGYVWFREWIHGRPRYFLPAAIALSLAGAIKPIYLFVGLPMIWDLLRSVGWRGFFRPAYLFFAAIVMVPLLTWYPYAQDLAAAFGDQYFYVGGNLPDFSFWLAKWSFYQNSLLTWPWEMVVGLPSLVFFGLGARAAWRKQKVWLATWIVGCFAVFILAAANVATPHDYYYLPMVPPLLYVTALGYRRIYDEKPIWAQRVTTGVLCLLPVFALVRVDQRYDHNDRFHEARTQTNATIGKDELVLAIDRTPGYLLYMVGRSGHRLDVDASWSDVLKQLPFGYRTLVVETRESHIVNPRIAEILTTAIVEREFTMLKIPQGVLPGGIELAKEKLMVPR